MFDPIVEFFAKIFNLIGKGIGWVVAAALWPFMTFASWYKTKKWLIKGPIGIVLLCIVVFYGWSLFRTQIWSGFDEGYANNYTFQARSTASGDGVSEDDESRCTPSGIIIATSDLIDFNVNQNSWISSTLFYKMGFFGMNWDRTPFFDDKASFQRGVHQAVRRVSVELVDRLGRVRGTSQFDKDLQDARGNLQFDESTWYFSLDPLGPKTPTPSFYRSARRSLDNFNKRLGKCDAVFDARADNLIQLLERITGDIGSTSDILKKRSEDYNSGWFDTRADDRFWFAYGQLYAYSGLLKGIRYDFAEVINRRGLTPLWDRMEAQVNSALALQPWILSNGKEDGFIMPTHLTTMGFYVLRVRSNMIEARDILDR